MLSSLSSHSTAAVMSLLSCRVATGLQSALQPAENSGNGSGAQPGGTTAAAHAPTPPAPLPLPFSSLTRLQLDFCGGGSDDMRRVAPPPAALTAALLRLPALRRLGLSWKRIEAAHLVAVVAMTGLRWAHQRPAYVWLEVLVLGGLRHAHRPC